MIKSSLLCVLAFGASCSAEFVPYTPGRCRVFTENELATQTIKHTYPMLAECAVFAKDAQAIPLLQAVNSTDFSNSFSLLRRNQKIYTNAIASGFPGGATPPAVCSTAVALAACTSVYSPCDSTGIARASMLCEGSIEAVAQACGGTSPSSAGAQIASYLKDTAKLLVNEFGVSNDCWAFTAEGKNMSFTAGRRTALLECAAPHAELIDAYNAAAAVADRREDSDCSKTTEMYPIFAAKGCGGNLFRDACNLFNYNECVAECHRVAREAESSPTPTGDPAGNDPEGNSSTPTSSSSSSSAGLVSAANSMVLVASAAAAATTAILALTL
jgi:hypothetical protein